MDLETPINLPMALLMMIGILVIAKLLMPGPPKPPEGPCTAINTDDLVEFIRSYRGPIDLRVAATELEKLGRYGAGWPRRSRDEWEREIQDLVAAGRLQRAGGMISVPPPVPEPTRQPELHQPWLFP